MHLRKASQVSGTSVKYQVYVAGVVLQSVMPFAIEMPKKKKKSNTKTNPWKFGIAFILHACYVHG